MRTTRDSRRPTMSNGKHCVDCHFLVKDLDAQRDPVRVRTVDVEEAERAQARRGEYGWKKGHHALRCDFTVWDEGYNFDPAKQHFVIVETDRSGECFFWPHRPGMLMPAARLLQDRESEYSRASRDRKMTICGLFIAAAALAVQSYLSCAQPMKWWPFK